MRKEKSQLILIVSFFVSAFALSPVFAETEPVPAYWTQYYLSASSQQGYQCPALYSAMDAVFSVVPARDLDFTCRVYGGAELQFTSLSLEPEQASDEPLSAYWMPVQLTLQRSDRYCTDVAHAIRWLLSYLPVRNLTSSVFCNSDNGYLHYRFETLQSHLRCCAVSSKSLS